MYIIIVGCTRVGASLVDRLVEEGHDVAVVDRDEASFALLGSGCNCMTVAGVTIDEDVLKQAGIEKADALAAVTCDDNANIMTAQIAQRLYGVPGVVARIDDPDKRRVFSDIGLATVCATSLAADAVFSALKEGRTK